MARANETLVVLKPGRATIAVIELAEQYGWRFVQRIEPTPRRFYEEIYEVPGNCTIVRTIDDHFVQIIYVALQGEHRAEVEELLRRELRTVDDAALEARLRSESSKERAEGIRILAAMAPDTADPRTVEAFTRAAQDESPEVTKALVVSVGRAAWPELWPVIDRLVERGAPGAEDLKAATEAHVPRPA